MRAGDRDWVRCVALPPPPPLCWRCVPRGVHHPRRSVLVEGSIIEALGLLTCPCCPLHFQMKDMNSNRQPETAMHVPMSTEKARQLAVQAHAAPHPCSAHQATEPCCRAEGTRLCCCSAEAPDCAFCLASAESRARQGQAGARGRNGAGSRRRGTAAPGAAPDDVLCQGAGD